MKRLRELLAQQQSPGDIQMENQSLRETLAAHGIAAPSTGKCTLNAGLAGASVSDVVQLSLVGGPGPGQHLEPSIPSPVQGPFNLLLFPEEGVDTASMPAPADLGYRPDQTFVLDTHAGRGTSDINVEAFDFVMR